MRLNYEIIKLVDNEHYLEVAATWFHQKWGYSEDIYRASMKECLMKHSVIPQWYLVLYEKSIIAGAGVIENDFHERKDLSPNVVALYVEDAFRNQKIAGTLLAFISDDFFKMGVDTLYLISDHTHFYERYGWEYMCMVQEDNSELTRMYCHIKKGEIAND